MHIRSFQLSDYASVNKLLSEVLSEACYLDTLEALTRQLSFDSALVLIAEMNQRIVGLLIGTVDQDHGYYYRIAVATDQQRKGIGKTLIRAMKDRFMLRKVRKIMVTADSHNTDVLPLYESLGFLPCKEAIDKLRIVNG